MTSPESTGQLTARRSALGGMLATPRNSLTSSKVALGSPSLLQAVRT